MHKFVGWLVAAVLVWHEAVGLAIPGNLVCQGISEATKVELVRYVANRYKLPQKVRLEMAELAVTEACYHHLQFFSKAPGHPFQVQLYLSPDQRFLSPDLYDSRTEPSHEIQLRHQAMQLNLTSGAPPSLGRKDAPVTVVIFSDFQCPFCNTAASLLERDVLPMTEGKVRVVFRHLPLPNHDWARRAAEAAACAGLQSNAAFWAIHDFIFASQSEIAAATVLDKLTEAAKSLPTLNMERFRECIDNRQGTEVILGDENLAKLYDVGVTPTLFVNGVKHAGIGHVDEFKLMLEEYLRRAGHNIRLMHKSTTARSSVDE